VILAQLLPDPQQDVTPARRWKLRRMCRMPATAWLQTVASYAPRLNR
jgi:hypothetical protein